MAQYDGSIKIDTKLDTSGFESGLNKLKTGAAAAGAAVAAGLGAAISAGIDFESAFAGIRKTVDASEEEFAALEAGIRSMALEIPQSASALASIGEAAGQLGIETQNIEKFTEVMANLGVATNMTSEQAATDLARIANITGMSQENFDRMGATIVALGNNLATTESEIVSMSLRLAGAGNQVGMTEAEIMSFSGALSSVGIEAEAGGTAFSKLMSDMQLATVNGEEDLQGFADVAGMTASEFKAAFEQDAAGAIIAFIQGLSRSEEQGKTAIQVLEELDITEIRMRDALLRAAGASDVFTESIEIGTEAWDENAALTKEAEQRYQTMESQLQLLKNNVTELGITIYQALNETMGDAVAVAVDAVSDLTQSLKSGQLKSAIQSVGELFGNIVEVLTRVASIVIPAVINVLAFLGDHLNIIIPLLTTFATVMATWSIVNTVTNYIRNATTATAAYSAAQAASTVATAANTAANVANTAANTARTASVTLGQVAIGLLTGKITLATAAQWLWNTALNANPIGIIITAVAALAAGITALTLVMGEQKTATQEAIEKQKELTQTLNEERDAWDQRRESTEKNLSSDLSKIQKVETLKDELLQLAGATGTVQEKDRARAQYILGELSTALGTEYTMTGNIISNYQQLTSEIDLLIAKKRAQAIIDANQADYGEALASIKEKQNQIAQQALDIDTQEAKITAKNNELQQLKNELQEEGASMAAADYNAKLRRTQTLQLEIDSENELLGEMQKNYDTLNKDLNGYAKVVNDVDSLNEALATNSLPEINSAISEFGSTVKTASQLTGSSMSEMQSEASTQLELMASKFGETKKLFESGALTQADVDSAKDELLTAAKTFTDVGLSMTDSIIEGVDGSKTTMLERVADIMGISVDEAKEVLGIEGVSSSVTNTEIGAPYAQGIASGISGNTNIVKAAARKLARDAKFAAQAELGIHSPSRVMRDEVGAPISEGIAVGIEDKSDLSIEALEDMQDEMLDSEQKYLDEKARIEAEEAEREEAEQRKRYEERLAEAETAEEIEEIKNEEVIRLKKKADEEYLEELEAQAEREREAYDAWIEEQIEALEQYKEDVKDIYADIAAYAEEEIGAVIEAQEALEQKLKDFGGLTTQVTYTDQYGNEVTQTGLHDISQDIKTMEQYRDSLLELKDRIGTIGLSDEDLKEFFSVVAGMSVEEGLEFVNLLLNQSDADFTNYLQNWAKKQDVAEEISEEVYWDDMEEAVNDTLSYMQQKLEEFGLEVPETFAVSGSLSAERFGEEFVAELQQQMDGIEDLVASYSLDMIPSIVFEGTSSKYAAAGANGGSVVYNTSYTFASSGEPVSQQLRTARNAETLKRYRGE